jgi:hypothetical protein
VDPHPKSQVAVVLPPDVEPVQIVELQRVPVRSPNISMMISASRIWQPPISTSCRTRRGWREIGLS